MDAPTTGRVDRYLSITTGGDLALFNRLYHLYVDSFESIRHRCVQRHMLRLGEFTKIMQDYRLAKFVKFNADRIPIGLAVITNDLYQVDLIEPRYFSRRWPEESTKRKIWYVMFVAVERSSGPVFMDLIEAMFKHAQEVTPGAHVWMDTSGYTDRRGLPDAAIKMVQRWDPSATLDTEDTQTYRRFVLSDQFEPDN